MVRVIIDVLDALEVEMLGEVERRARAAAAREAAAHATEAAHTAALPSSRGGRIVARELRPVRAVEWHSEHTHMTLGRHSESNRKAIGWHSAGSRMAIGWRPDGNQMAPRWHSPATSASRR